MTPEERKLEKRRNEAAVVDVSDVALKALRKKAEMATPLKWELAEAGPAKFHFDNARFIRSTQEGTEHGAVAVVPLGPENAEFIAAASPAVIIRLLDEITRLRKAQSES